jgi:carbonic anhydrase
MKFIATTSAFVVACALASSSVSAAGATGAPWGYKLNDSTLASPAHWGDYYPRCNGTSQSPIDIVSADAAQNSKAKSSLRFRGDCPSFNLTQNAEGFKASVVGGTF